jgi:hypothetical protein
MEEDRIKVTSMYIEPLIISVPKTISEVYEALRTYVKIEGKNVEPIVQKLAKLAVDFSEVCVWDINMRDTDWRLPTFPAPAMGDMGTYFGMEPDAIEKHCDRIISKSGADLGDASIYYEWLEPPSDEQLNKLRKLIDETIKPFGNKYIITDKE